MTLVKFGFGAASKYVAGTMAGMIYFATDTNQIYLDGKAYGYSTTDAALLKKSIKSISLGADQKTITVTANDDTSTTVVLQEASTTLAGLMSAADKVILNTLNGDVNTEGSVKKQIADATKAITDNLVEVKAGNGLDEAEEDNEKTISVKAANESINVSADGIKTNLSLVLDDANKADTTLHQYKLSDGKNTYGVAIEIPKDKNLAKAYMGHVDDALTNKATSAEVTSGTGAVALCLVYQIADGTYGLVAIPASSFFTEQAFGNGLQVTTGVVSVKLAQGSEEFLTVTADGVKLSGVADAIAAAVKASSVKITEVGTGHVKVTKTGDDTNGYTYTITAEDIASDAELKALVTRFNAVTGQSGNTYVADSEANFIDDATSLHNADQILDSNLKTLQDALTWFEADSAV